jgi:hypothetical protein
MLLKNSIEYKIYVNRNVFLCCMQLFLYVSHTKINSVRCYNFTCLHVNNPLFLPHSVKIEFSHPLFEKKPQKLNFMKIRPREAEVFHADRQNFNRRVNSLFS